MVIPCSFPDSSVCTNPLRSTLNEESIFRTSASSCDVHFIVGPDGDTWTISGRREVLISSSEVLAAILRDSGTTIRLPDTDKRGFEHLLRHIEGSEIKFTSVSTARTTLDVACKFQCVGLVRICITYLDLNLNVNNVLNVYKNLSKYCNNAHTCEPCAPEYNASTPSESATSILNMCSALLHNCLILIDNNASEVITQEEFEFLDFKDMSTIVNRDSLWIKDEVVLFDCIIRWLKCECMRLGNRPVNPVTRKEIIGDLIYKVRYGLMNKNEFLNGPSRSGIFNSNEINEILYVIANKNSLESQHDLLRVAHVKRHKSNLEPNCLSPRTESKKNVKDKKIKVKKDNSKALLNCLTVWTVLFD